MIWVKLVRTRRRGIAKNKAAEIGIYYVSIDAAEKNKGVHI